MLDHWNVLVANIVHCSCHSYSRSHDFRNKSLSLASVTPSFSAKKGLTNFGFVKIDNPLSCIHGFDFKFAEVVTMIFEIVRVHVHVLMPVLLKSLLAFIFPNRFNLRFWKLLVHHLGSCFWDNVNIGDRLLLQLVNFLKCFHDVNQWFLLLNFCYNLFQTILVRLELVFQFWNRLPRNSVSFGNLLIFKLLDEYCL